MANLVTVCVKLQSYGIEIIKYSNSLKVTNLRVSLAVEYM